MVGTRLGSESTGDSEMIYLEYKTATGMWMYARVLGLVSVAATRVRSCDSPCTGAREGYDDGDSETERDGLDE